MCCPGVFLGGDVFRVSKQLYNQLHGEHINTPENERSNGKRPFGGVFPTKKSETFHLPCQFTAG